MALDGLTCHRRQSERPAIEQLACLGLVTAELHPAIRCIDRELRLTKASIAAFTATVEAKGREGPRPSNLAPLGTAVRLIGGRCKPWGYILEAMTSGKMPYWMTDRPGKFLNKILIRPGDIAPFASLRFDEADWPNFPFDRTVTQIDAAEILNIDAIQIRTVIDDGTLKFEPAGVALRTSKASVLALAEQTISTSEAAARLGTDFRQIAGMLNRQPNLQRQHFGRSRCDFDAWRASKT